MSDYIRDRQLAATSRRRDFVLPPMRWCSLSRSG